MSAPDAAVDQTGERPRHRSAQQVERSEQNRATIVTRALELFAHNGYSKTTLQAVSARVGLTRQGVLHHFRSKEGLFREVIEEGHRWARRQDDASGPAAGSAALRALSQFVHSTRDVHIRFVHILQAEAMHEDAPEHVVDYVIARLARVRGHIATHLREAQEQGAVDLDLDVEAAATMIAAAVNGLQSQALLEPGLDVQAAFDVLMALITSSGWQEPD